MLPTSYLGVVGIVNRRFVDGFLNEWLEVVEDIIHISFIDAVDIINNIETVVLSISFRMESADVEFELGAVCWNYHSG